MSMSNGTCYTLNNGIIKKCFYVARKYYGSDQNFSIDTNGKIIEITYFRFFKSNLVNIGIDEDIIDPKYISSLTNIDDETMTPGFPTSDEK